MFRPRWTLAVALIAGLPAVLSGSAQGCVIEPALEWVVGSLNREALVSAVEQRLRRSELAAEAIYLDAVKAEGGDVDGLQVTHRLSMVKPFKGALDRGQIYVARMLVPYKGCGCGWMSPGARCDPPPIGYPFRAAENERMIVFMTPRRTSNGLAYTSLDEVVRNGPELPVVSEILSTLARSRR